MSEKDRRRISGHEPLKAALEQLLAWVVDLEARLNPNPGDRSKPPSSAKELLRWRHPLRTGLMAGGTHL